MLLSRLGQRNYRRPVPAVAMVKRELSLEEKFWVSRRPANTVLYAVRSLRLYASVRMDGSLLQYIPSIVLHEHGHGNEALQKKTQAVLIAGGVQAAAVDEEPVRLVGSGHSGCFAGDLQRFIHR